MRSELRARRTREVMYRRGSWYVAKCLLLMSFLTCRIKGT